MAIQTKQDVLDKILAEPRPLCPHCNGEMSLWEVPPIDFSDGLGWGTPYLYVCFNNECPLYVNAWSAIEEEFSHRASQRCLCYPGTEVFECMPVFSSVGGTGQIVDQEVLAERQRQEEAIKAGFAELAELFRDNDAAGMLSVLLDAVRPARVRLKAAEMVGDRCGLEALEPLKNAKFGNEILSKKVSDAVASIHERTFTRDCPFCAEIIKVRAKVCKHCGKEVAGE